VTHLILWALIGCSMLAWAWSSLRAGRLDDRQFVVFSIGLVLGQLAGAVEAFLSGAYGTCVSQLYFCAFTLLGAFHRWSGSQYSHSAGRGAGAPSEVAASAST
jgi:hypothetical protein